MKSPLYRSGTVFRIAMRLLHGPDLDRKYAHICKFISPGDRVLDVGCGTATLQSHLNGNEYLGLEMNDKFIAYARKKGRNVMKQDAMKFRRFRDFDVCVMMDVLHHLNPRHARLVKRALSGVKKTLIISEPFEVPDRHGMLKRISRILDDDGINDSGEWMDKDGLARFYAGFKPARVDCVGASLIAVYQKKGAKGKRKHRAGASGAGAAKRAPKK